MKIGSLSPSPLWGGPTFREGWGEGWILNQFKIAKAVTASANSSSLNT